MRHLFCAQRASIQHRSRNDSAAAAPAPTLLSATQHLPASDHDDTPASSCLAPHTLQAPQLAPKQMRWIFCAGRPSISIAHAVNQRPQHQHSRCSLRHSVCRHPSIMPLRKAVALRLRSFMHPICPRNWCATISAPSAHRYSIAQAVIQRPRHQHSRSSLRHSVCQHPSMMPHRQAPA